MRYLLSPACEPILERLAKERTLCAFDFDGTLSPIVEHPDDARMRPQTRRLLGRLAAAFPCVILSGRAGPDVTAKIGSIRVERILGNHGAEIAPAAAKIRLEIDRWESSLLEKLNGLDGVWIENKNLSLAVHYRQSENKAGVRKNILTAARQIEGARVFSGKQVINLTMKGSPHKGAALMAERDRLRCEWVLFVGDDDNDEDAFAIGGNLIATRIRRKRESKAGYYLRSQLEIDQLLERLVKLRGRSNLC